MKKIKKLLLAIVLVFPLIVPVAAKEPTLIVTVDKSEVEVGETVTFTVSVTDGAGKVDISGAVSDSVWLENSSQTYAVEASESGTMTLTANGKVAELEYETEKPEMFTLSDSASVTVLEPEEPEVPVTPPVDPEEPEDPVTPPVEPDEPEEPELSDDATLDYLDVDRGELSPEFSSDVYNYTVELTSEDNEIEIYASCNDDNATLSGTGLKPIKVGSNSFTIDVTAEDGTRQAYTINVNVKEVPTIFFDFGDKKLGVMSEVEKADIPKGFTETERVIQEKDVKAFINSNNSLTLLLMVDENENKGFYVYDEEDGILGLYRPVFIDGKEYFILNIPEKIKEIEKMTFTSLSLDTETFDGWMFVDEDLQNYSVMYLMNTKGEIGYYVYDGTAKKIQAYPDGSPLTADELMKFIQNEPEKETPWLLYAGIGGAVVLVIGIIAFVLMKNKKKDDDDDDFEDEDETPVVVHDRTLVTDETFFKSKPMDETKEISEETEAPLIIETALSGLSSDDLEETFEVPTDFVEEASIENVEDDSVTEKDDEDDWLDEKMFNILMSDDDDE